MLKINFYVYIICAIFTYKMLSQYLSVIDKKTKRDVADTERGKLVLMFAKIFFSATWIISLPYLYLKKEGK